MVDKEKIIENYVKPEVVGHFFILDDSEESWLYGDIIIDETFDQFRSLVKGEIEFSWGQEFSNLDDYKFYHIDTEDKDNLITINDEEIFQKVRKLEEIFIAIIHNNITYKIIENIPPLFDWYQEYFLN